MEPPEKDHKETLRAKKLKLAAYACIAVSLIIVILVEWNKTASGTAIAILTFVGSAILMEKAENIEQKRDRRGRKESA